MPAPRWKAAHRGVLGGLRHHARLGRREAVGVGARQRAVLGRADDALRFRRELVAGQALVDRGAELAGDHRAEGGHREQPGDARDGVVDARSDARVALVGVGQHGRGQRRHGGRQPEREEQQRGQEVGDVVDVGVDALEHREARRGDQRAARP